MEPRRLPRQVHAHDHHSRERGPRLLLDDEEPIRGGDDRLPDEVVGHDDELLGAPAIGRSSGRNRGAAVRPPAFAVKLGEKRAVGSVRRPSRVSEVERRAPDRRNRPDATASAFP